MGRFGEDRFGLVFIGDSQNVARVARGEVEDRLPEGDEDVLSLPGDQGFSADELAAFSLACASAGTPGLGVWFLSSR